jgi:putative oxidoreductase
VCTAACLPLLGVLVTFAEAGLGILLILGLATRVSALLSSLLTLTFAAPMTLVLGTSRTLELLGLRVLGSIISPGIAGA